MKLSRVAGGGWMAGWVVGNSDFNENPVVSLDLDLDFVLVLRVCQNLWLQQNIPTDYQKS